MSLKYRNVVVYVQGTHFVTCVASTMHLIDSRATEKHSKVKEWHQRTEFVPGKVCVENMSLVTRKVFDFCTDS